MHNKICEILENLGIDVAFIEYEGKSKEYIIFSIYDNREDDFVDDDNECEEYSINITYWFKSKSNINEYKRIKALMKENGFIFESGKDMKDDGYFGNSLDFNFTQEKEC